jgi:hypothetical protein
MARPLCGRLGTGPSGATLAHRIVWTSHLRRQRTYGLLRQLDQGLLTLHGGKGYFGLESRRVVPAGSLAHRLSCSAAILATVRQKLHLSLCSNFPSQLFDPVAVFVLTELGLEYLFLEAEQTR